MGISDVSSSLPYSTIMRSTTPPLSYLYSSPFVPPNHAHPHAPLEGDDSFPYSFEDPNQGVDHDDDDPTLNFNFDLSPEHLYHFSNQEGVTSSIDDSTPAQLTPLVELGQASSTNTSGPPLVITKWTAEEDSSLKSAVEMHGAKNWKHVSLFVDAYEITAYSVYTTCFLFY